MAWVTTKTAGYLHHATRCRVMQGVAQNGASNL